MGRLVLEDKLFQLIQKEVHAGYILENKHPELPITIYNYSKKTQFESHWNEATKCCRGLVVADDGRVVVECVPKFFNLGQEGCEINTSHIHAISEKLDGYYISIKKDPEFGLIINSRGSFQNKYVDRARDLLSPATVDKLKEGFTYFCELCADFEGDEGIIVARHEIPKLICWAIKNEKNEEILPAAHSGPFETARIFTPKEAERYLKGLVEGIVVCDMVTHERIKVKTEWYLNMHRLISGFTYNKVYDLVCSGRRIEEEDVPDEFYPTAKKWQDEILKTLQEDISKAQFRYETTKLLPDKEFALLEKDDYMRSLVFCLRKHNQKRLEEIIIRHHRTIGSKGVSVQQVSKGTRLRKR